MHSNPHVSLQFELQNENGGANQFLITREKLAEVVEANRTTDALQHYGGIHNIASALRTSLDAGIPGDQTDLHLRRQAFGSNSTSPSQPQNQSPQTIKYIKHLLSDAVRDSTILLLVCCAMLSLAIAVKTNGVAEVIIDGVFTILSICFVVFCGAVIRYLRDRWMRRKSLKRKNKIRVVRNGFVHEILESELVVGDIVFLQSGDYVPADGIFIDGDSFHFDDHSSLFMGVKVDKGHCRMMVTSVGENTERSRLLRSIGFNQTQLLEKIEETNSKLEKIWLSLSLILLVLQFVRCFTMKAVQADKDNRNLDPKGVKNTVEDLMKESIHLMKKERLKANSLVAMLCVLLFATRDGLPSALFISLLYGANRMKSVDAHVQRIEASATVGLVTTVCACETDDFALDHSKMADLWIGFQLVENGLIGGVDGRILEVLREAILLHADAAGGLDKISLLTWGRAVLGLNMEFLRECSSMARYEDGGLCCWIVKREIEGNKVMRVHWKGDLLRILYMCSHYYTVDGRIETLDANKKTSLLQIVYSLVLCSQPCFAFAYKQEIEAAEEEEEEDLESHLTLLGFVCLKNPYSPQLIQAITEFRKFGVEIKLMVDCDVNTARIMAVNTGLVTREEEDHGGDYSAAAVVEAGDFRSSSDRTKMADNIRVMANASPADKLLMMRCLRQNGHVVAATAVGIRDLPVLKEADVGLFIDSGSDKMKDLSKEDADVTVASSDFSQILEIVNLGRSVCRNLGKLVQLQLTMEISTFIINILSLAATSKLALNSFQLIWIYVIVGIVGGIGVAITTIDNSISSENPVYGSGRVVNRAMCRNIALQCLFQLCVISIMVMKGKLLFKVNESALQTMVFSCYAFCQVFLLIPAIELKRNDVVAGLCEGKSCLFLAVVAAVGVLQVAVVEVMGIVADCARLELKQWCICIGIASFSLPLNFICGKFHRIMYVCE